MIDGCEKIFIDSNHGTLYGSKNNDNECEIIHRKFLSENTRLFCENPEIMSGDAPQHFIVRKINNNNLVGEVNFQNNFSEDIDGLTDEEVIIMVITRLKYFQRSKCACAENESAICALTSALYALRESVNKRKCISTEDI